ncbi:MAG: adenosylcobalamin-dependent ribonucleoside-diphosphate reductase [Bdellovibrio sp.]
MFGQKKVLAPASWSENAVTIAASKYFRHKEKSIFHLVERVLGALELQAKRQKMSDLQRDLPDLRLDLLAQKASFNSPVWFNCGLTEAYGVASPNTHWIWDHHGLEVQQNLKARPHPQLSACFILSVDDSIDGIFGLALTEARLFKFGSGSGTNFSSLRGKTEKLENGGTSSGILSFLDVLDRGAGAIKSGGTNRRAAKMVVVDVDHPDVLSVIHWKAREEEKARALIAAGFSGGFEGEAYQTVGGQNANISIRVNSQFMRAVESDLQWKLVERVSRKKQKIPAREILREMAQMAWASADPGIQFDEAIQRWHTCSKSGPIRASNPCSEFLFLDNSACNLASVNLLPFIVTSPRDFLWKEFAETSLRVFRCQELFVDYASYPTKETAFNSHIFRPLGLGICGLGAALMRMALPYASAEARDFAASVMAYQTGLAYRESARMARKKGPFLGFAKNRQAMLKVLGQHQSRARDLLGRIGHWPIAKEIEQLWGEVIFEGSRVGFRHAQVTALAPTGTISLVMDAESTGIEPLYALRAVKQLSGGGKLSLVSKSVEWALRRLAYSQTEVRRALTLLRESGGLESFDFRDDSHRAIFHVAHEIAPSEHLSMLAEVQNFVSGGISKTINLPATASVQDIENLYFEAWKKGVKSLSIYRDTSKFTQILWYEDPSRNTPLCTECGSRTELSGSCWRCLNCGAVTACA